MKRVFWALLLMGICSIHTVSAVPLSDYQQKMYDLFIQQKIPQWEPILSQMCADKSCATLDGRHEILCGYYGHVGHLVDKKKKEQADELSGLDDDLADMTDDDGQNHWNE